MDLLLLKNYKHLLRKGTIVIIPIAPFYSILGSAKETMTKPDREKYFNIFSESLREENKDLFDDIDQSYRKRIRGWRYIFKDEQLDIRMQLSYNPMMYDELESSAKRRIEAWKKEFDIVNFEDALTDINEERRKISKQHLYAIINYCKEQGYLPVLTILPMTNHLLKRMSNAFLNNYLYSFVKPIADETNVILLDYINDDRFTKGDYYIDLLYMNRKGADVFTKQVLKDLGI